MAPQLASHRTGVPPVGNLRWTPGRWPVGPGEKHCRFAGANPSGGESDLRLGGDSHRFVDFLGDLRQVL